MKNLKCFADVNLDVKKTDNFLDIDYYDNEYYENIPWASGEVSLWRGVIMQALIDCYTMSKRTEDQNARRDAFGWFSKKNHDFVTVCNYANMEVDYVLRKAKEAISRGCMWKKDQNKQNKIYEIKKNELKDNIINLNPDLFRKVVG